MTMLLYVLLGTIFGFILSRSGAADYNFIQGMFLFEQFQVYGIIGTAVALTAPGLWALKRYGRTVTGRPLEIELKPLHRGNIVGGLLFGVGWSMAGHVPRTDLREHRRGQTLCGRRAGGRARRRRSVRNDLLADAGPLQIAAARARNRKGLSRARFQPPGPQNAAATLPASVRSTIECERDEQPVPLPDVLHDRDRDARRRRREKDHHGRLPARCLRRDPPRQRAQQKAGREKDGTGGDPEPQHTADGELERAHGPFLPLHGMLRMNIIAATTTRTAAMSSFNCFAGTSSASCCPAHEPN